VEDGESAREEPLTTPEWIAAARALAELTAAVRDAPAAARAETAADPSEGAGGDGLGPLDVAGLLAAAPSKAARAYVLRAAAAATATTVFYTRASPALTTLRASLLAEVAGMSVAPSPGSEADEELAAVLAALTAWGDAGDLATSVAASLMTIENSTARMIEPVSKKAKKARATPVSDVAAKAAVARRCLRLLLCDRSSRLALLEASALEPLTCAARTHAAALLADVSSLTAATSTDAADAATAYGKAAMHLALSGGGNTGAVVALEELLRWAGGNNPASTPAPITAAVLTLCTEAAEMGLLEDAPVAAGAAARFGNGAVQGLARGRADDAAIVVGANRATARLAANLAAPCAGGGFPAGAAPAAVLAVNPTP
jgi:hypothetical protein